MKRIARGNIGLCYIARAETSGAHQRMRHAKARAVDDGVGDHGGHNLAAQAVRLHVGRKIFHHGFGEIA